MDKSEKVVAGQLSRAEVGQTQVGGAVGRVLCCWPDPTWLGGAVPGDDRQWSPKMLSLDGLEMIAVLVVMGLFIKVLEQFGMFEPVGGEGN